ncbi:hypothetical protein OLZ32_20820 [Rhizobium sp. 1AS11]|uniref:Uncharacterized protein n=1 Tax=Rhizobium aouanii TaxID=3118145 RepID=A0ABU8CLT2_9HYPH|nr:hypothetical protein [Rhizobium acaciae]MCW1410854.1 hypothetical protein [Rhizobium acaciae]MCW1742847.1 hypothetical protein [Rhizobium acaciae]MCW1750043.1 hypothetical protein [Rhizobium acaciae]
MLGNRAIGCAQLRRYGVRAHARQVLLTQESARHQQLARKEVHLHLATRLAAIIGDALFAIWRRLDRTGRIWVARLVGQSRVTEGGMADFVADKEGVHERIAGVFMQDAMAVRIVARTCLGQKRAARFQTGYVDDATAIGGRFHQRQRIPGIDALFNQTGVDPCGLLTAEFDRIHPTPRREEVLQCVLGRH